MYLRSKDEINDKWDVQRASMPCAKAVAVGWWNDSSSCGSSCRCGNSSMLCIELVSAGCALKQELLMVS
jgi:hypothetical protein